MLILETRQALIERSAITKDGSESRGKWTGFGRSNDNEREEGLYTYI